MRRLTSLSAVAVGAVALTAMGGGTTSAAPGDPARPMHNPTVRPREGGLR